MYTRGSRRSRDYGYHGGSSSYRRSYDDDSRRRSSYGGGGGGYIDSATQVAAANAILSVLMKSQDRGFKRRFDYRDDYDSAPYKRGRYISRGGYRGSRGSSYYSRDYRSRPKKDDEEEKEDKSKDCKYRCHICRTGTDAEQEHLDHLKEESHLKNMSRRKESYVRQIQAVVFKLREFEDTGPGPRGFCIICNVGYTCTIARHNSSRLHRDMKNLKSSACRYCDLQFNERVEYDEHLLTVKHIETRAKALEEGKLIDLDELKVVDSVGDDDDEMEDLSFPEEYDDGTAVGLQVVDNVTGYFCKICVTYFTKDSCDSKTHCKTKEHFEKFVEYAKTRKEEIAKQREEDEAAAAAEAEDGNHNEAAEESGDVKEGEDEAVAETEEAELEEQAGDEELEETTEVNGET